MGVMKKFGLVCVGFCLMQTSSFANCRAQTSVGGGVYFSPPGFVAGNGLSAAARSLNGARCEDAVKKVLSQGGLQALISSGSLNARQALSHCKVSGSSPVRYMYEYDDMKGPKIRGQGSVQLSPSSCPAAPQQPAASRVSNSPGSGAIAPQLHQ